MKPDLITYNTLLKACMRSANLPCAEVIMTQLCQQGLQVWLFAHCKAYAWLEENHESQLSMVGLLPDREFAVVSSLPC